jgi:hypothetical protein
MATSIRSWSISQYGGQTVPDPWAIPVRLSRVDILVDLTAQSGTDWPRSEEAHKNGMAWGAKPSIEAPLISARYGALGP